MQLKPKKKPLKTATNLRFRFSGKNRGFDFGSVPVRALDMTGYCVGTLRFMSKIMKTKSITGVNVSKQDNFASY